MPLPKPNLYPGSPRPTVKVTAAYTIENPTDKKIEVDFGFPVLRDPGLSAAVDVDGHSIRHELLWPGKVFGAIRHSALQIVHNAIVADPQLGKLTMAVRKSPSAKSRAALMKYLTGTLKWNERDAALMTEYPLVDFSDAAAGLKNVLPQERGIVGDMGSLTAIGSQKATQCTSRSSRTA